MLNHHIALISLDVCIPVQEFRADYTIVQNNKLPFVREFILRLLDLSNMSNDQIGKFMGFSAKETQVALSQLINLEEIAVNDKGKFQLTPKSKSYFNSQQENRPKIQCLEELRKSFKFDLLTFSYVKSSVRVGNDMSSIRLYPSEEYLSKSAKVARSAFQRQFHQIHDEENFGFLVIDSPELYKISSFKKQSEKFQRFSQTYGVDTNNNTVEPIISHDFLSHEQVVTLLSSHLRDNRPADNVREVARIFDGIEYDYGVSALKRGYLDVSDYAIEAKRTSQADLKYHPLIGSFTLSENWDFFENQLKKANRHHAEKTTVRWIAPSDNYWAKSEIQLQRFESLSKIKNVELEVYLPVPSRRDKKVRKSYMNQFRSISDSLQGFVEGYLSGFEEVVIIENKSAFFFCYLYQNENLLPIPVGFMTEDQNIISSLASSFNEYLSTLDEDYEPKGLGHLNSSSN